MEKMGEFYENKTYLLFHAHPAHPIDQLVAELHASVGVKKSKTKLKEKRHFCLWTFIIPT